MNRNGFMLVLEVLFLILMVSGSASAASRVAENYMNTTTSNATEFFQSGNAVLDASDEANLNVNSSDFWDNYNTPSGWDLNETDDYYLNGSRNMTGNVTFDTNLTYSLGDSIYWLLSVYVQTIYTTSVYATTLYEAGTALSNKYILQSSESNLNVNGSDYWDNLGSLNASQLEDSGGALHIIDAWLTAFVDNWLGTKDTDDLTEGTTNLYDNTTWNESRAGSVFIAQSNEGNLNVNSSDYWDTYGTANSSQFENDGGELHVVEAWITAFINNWLLGKDTDDLTEGSTNLYDNQTWNETGAKTVFQEDISSDCTSGFVKGVDDDGTLDCAVPIDSNATSECANGEYLDGGGSCLDVNDTIDIRTASTTYNATTVDTIDGTYDAGDVDSIKISEDDISYNVSEDAGADPLTIIVNFTNVADFDSVFGRIWYEGGLGHKIQIEILRTDTGVWENYIDFTDTSDFVNIYIPVFDPVDHIDAASNVSIRFYHAQNGVPTHNFYIDYLILVEGFASTTADHDALSDRDNKANHPWAFPTDASRLVTGDINTTGSLNSTSDSFCNNTVCYPLANFLLDTNASTACSGGTTYLDGDGNCDDISSVYIDESDEGSLNVNSSDYWDNLDAPLVTWVNTFNQTYHDFWQVNRTSTSNSSGYWDNFASVNTTQFENDIGELHIIAAWLTAFIDDWLLGKDTDDITEGSSNLYDNMTWNQTLGELLFADISVVTDNATWNQTLAQLLFADITIVTDNATWNQTLGELLFADISVVTDNATWNQTLGQLLFAPISVTGDNTTWNQTLARSLFADITVVTDNATWNQTLGELLFAPISVTTDNATWNQTLGELLFAPISVTGDNTTWNQTLGEALFAAISVVTDNSTWNQTLAASLFADISVVDTTISNCSVDLSCDAVQYDSEIITWSNSTYNGTYDAKVTDNATWDETLAKSLFMSIGQTVGNTTEQVQDAAGAMDGGTETRISVTYNDGTNEIDYIVDDMNDDQPDTDAEVPDDITVDSDKWVNTTVGMALPNDVQLWFGAHYIIFNSTSGCLEMHNTVSGSVVASC